MECARKCVSIGHGVVSVDPHTVVYKFIPCGDKMYGKSEPDFVKYVAGTANLHCLSTCVQVNASVPGCCTSPTEIRVMILFTQQLKGDMTRISVGLVLDDWGTAT